MVGGIDSSGEPLISVDMENHDHRSGTHSSRDTSIEELSANGGCSCCDGSDGDFEHFATKLRLQSEGKLIEADQSSGVLDVELPEESQEALEALLDGSRVSTLEDWVVEVRDRTDGGPIAMADLCHESDDTVHWGEIDGERYHFACFFDAIVLAALTDTQANIRTESPSGTEIEITITETGALRVVPQETLVSFGVTTVPELIPDGEPSREDVYATVCPVVKAFASPEAYAEWSSTVPASTVAIPLSEATVIAEALVS